MPIFSSHQEPSPNKAQYVQNTFRRKLRALHAMPALVFASMAKAAAVTSIIIGNKGENSSGSWALAPLLSHRLATRAPVTIQGRSAHQGTHSRGLGHATWPGSKWQTAMNRVIRKYNRSHNIKTRNFYYKKGFYGMVRSITPYVGSWWCLGSLLLLSVCNHISAHLSA